MEKLSNKRIFAALLCTLMLAVIFQPQVFATGVIDTNRDVTLTVDYRYGDTALPEAKFDVYKLANISPYSEFTLTSDFSDYPISVDGLDASGWNTLATTLKGYVQADKLAPTASGTTDADGRLDFTVKPGLYLVVGGGIIQDEYSYTCAPFVVCLPGTDTENNVWNYDVTVRPKAQRDRSYDPLDSSVITRKVLKVWEDHGYTDEIPNEIKITLYCDGQEKETVILNKANNWRYTWDNLERGHDWSVVEEAVEGYTVTITEEGQTFVVTNTNIKSAVDPVPVNPDKPLPQTSVLWWPVPILLMGGIILLGIGLRGRGKKDDA